MIHLSARLQAVADWIPPNARVADIGSDHGRLPAYLAQRGDVPHILATDLREKPLNRARALLTRCGLLDRVTLRLQDGLTGLTAGEADTMVLAGMGGDMLASLLAAGPVYPHVAYLIQPASRPETVRAFLPPHGFVIRRERLIDDNGRLYVLMDAAFTGQPGVLWPEGTGSDYLSPALLHDPLLSAYLARVLARLTKEYAALSQNPARRPDRLIYVRGQMSALQSLYNERTARP